MLRQKKNLRLLYYIQSFFSFSGSLISDMIAFYAESIGILRGLIGMMNGFNELLSYTSEVFWGYFSDKAMQRKVFLLFGVTAWTLLWIPILQTTHHALFIILILVQAILGGSIVPVFDALVFQNSTPRNRTHVITNLQIVDEMFGFIGTLVAAGVSYYYRELLLNNMEITRNLFILSAFVAFVSLAFVARIKEKPMKQHPNSLLKEVNFINKYFFQKNKKLRVFLLVNFIWTFAIGLPLGFYAIYIIKELGASIYFFFMSNAVIVMAGLAAIKSWEAFAQKHGAKTVLFFSSLLTIIGMMGYLFNYELIIFANIILGVGWAGYNMTIQVMFLNYLPKEDTAGFIGMFDLYTGVLFFIAPIIGGIIAGIYDIRAIIILSILIRIVIVPLFSLIKEGYEEITA